jgi:hypothetical protein
MKERIYIFCEGGLVQGVEVSNPDQEVIIIDRDIYDGDVDDEYDREEIRDLEAYIKRFEADTTTAIY